MLDSFFLEHRDSFKVEYPELFDDMPEAGKTDGIRELNMLIGLNE